MRVRVKLFATLAQFAPVEGLPGTPFEVELPEGASIGDVLHHIGIGEELVKIAFVNGIIQPVEFLLSAGDDIGIFPPIGGG
jgi:sulfur-carrier protein